MIIFNDTSWRRQYHHLVNTHETSVSDNQGDGDDSDDGDDDGDDEAPAMSLALLSVPPPVST